MQIDENAVLFEFHQIGSYVRVTAVDPNTYTEVSVQGPASASQSDLMRLALRRLQYVLDKKQAESGSQQSSESRNGIYI